MIRRISAFITALLVSGAAVWGQVKITPPTVVGNPGGVDTLLATTAQQLERDIDAEISQYYRQPKLAQAVANAGAATVHIGSQRSYIDYRAFSAVFGGGLTFTVPGLDNSAIQKAAKTLQQERDLYTAVAFQPAFSLGVRLGVFSDKLDDWYVNVKFGSLKLGEGALAPGLTYNSLTVGALVNYQLLETRRLPLGFLRWRGLSLGSGITYQQNEAAYSFEFGAVSQPVDLDRNGTNESRMTLKPEISAVAASNSVVIPIEANTGVRILWLLDLSVGAGVDLTFGGSRVDLKIATPVTVNNRSSISNAINDGAVAISAGTKDERPTILRPRLSGALALNLGPVKLEVPAMVYFEPNGNTTMFGLTLGIVW